MSWKKRWAIIGVLAGAQVGLITFYQGYIRANHPSATTNPGATARANERALRKNEPPALRPLMEDTPDATRLAWSRDTQEWQPTAPAPLQAQASPQEEVLPPIPGKTPEPTPGLPGPPPTSFVPPSPASTQGDQIIPPLSPPAQQVSLPAPPIPTVVAPVPQPTEQVAKPAITIAPVAPESLPPMPEKVAAPSFSGTGWKRQPDEPLAPVPPPSPVTPVKAEMQAAVQTPEAPTPQPPVPPAVAPAAPTPKPQVEPTRPVVPPPAPQPTPSVDQTSHPGALTKPVQSVGTCPWALRIEIIDGRTMLTAATGKEIQFQISCEKLALETPRGIIDAKGNVKLYSDGLDGQCDRLTIAWMDDNVILEGQALVKCHRDGQEVELKSARLSLRLAVTNSPGEPRRTTLVPTRRENPIRPISGKVDSNND